MSTRNFYRGCVPILLVSLVPVAAWLGPVIALSDADFLYNLLWRQTAERISGSLDGAHPQPFWFYLVLLPVMVMPWIFSPDLFRIRPLQRFRALAASRPKEFRMLRLLVLWLLGVLAVLSAVSGKQPHYLVPETPLFMIVFGYFMAQVSVSRIRNAAMGMLALFTAGQAAAALTVFDRLNLQPLASFVQMHHQAPWAFVGEYQGELNFLARLEAPIAVIDEKSVVSWEASHPDGYVIIKTTAPVATLSHVVFSQPANSGSYVVLHS